MNEGPNITRIAALIGDSARTHILTALMSGKALTATELANFANIGKSTASAHLSKLVDAQLLLVDKQGRHSYYRLANQDVALLLESLMHVAYRSGTQTLHTGPRDLALRSARVCYDHMAGEIAVDLFDRLVAKALLECHGQQVSVTATGLQWFEKLGVDTSTFSAAKREVCRACLDWSERRYHLAGSAGQALLQKFLDSKWVTRDPHSRVLHISPKGKLALRKLLPA